MQNTFINRIEKLTAKLDMLQQLPKKDQGSIAFAENIKSYIIRTNQTIKQLQNSIQLLETQTSSSMKNSRLFQKQVEYIISRSKLRMDKVLENYRKQFQQIQPDLKKEVRRIELFQNSSKSELQLVREQSLNACRRRIEQKIKELEKKQKQLQKKNSSHSQNVTERIQRNIHQTKEQIEHRNKRINSFEQKLNQLSFNLDKKLTTMLNNIKSQNYRKDFKIKQAFQKCLELI